MMMLRLSTMGRTDLVEALAAIQRANEWTDAEMARRLEVSASMWSLIQRRRRRFGGKGLRQVLRRFPELRDAVTNYLEAGLDELTTVSG
jgi:hypothetical protein